MEGVEAMDGCGIECAKTNGACQASQRVAFRGDGPVGEEAGNS